MGRFEQPRLASLARSREGAFFVAEQLAFQQRFREGGAVDRDERIPTALARIMDRLREQLLAGAAFTGDENGRIGPRITFRSAQGALEGGAVSQDLLEAVAGGELTDAPLGANVAVGLLDGIGVL